MPMYFWPPENFLYSAYKITTRHSDGIKTIEGVATGFIIEIAYSTPWIVTNRHVIDRDYNQKTSEYKNFKLIGLDITGWYPNNIEYTISIDPNATCYFHNDMKNDVVLIAPKYSKPQTQGFHWHFGIEDIAKEEIFQKIFPYDAICFSGFPRTHDQLMGKPIVRSGTIASDPKFNYSWDKEPKGACVAYEGFSTKGSSGSPIFALPRGMTHIPGSRRGFLIGINGGHIPEDYGHSGISYFYKSSIIYEIIEKYRLKEVTFPFYYDP